MHYGLFEVSGGYYEGANASNAYPAMDLQSTNMDTVKISSSFKNVLTGGICVRQSVSSPTKLGILRIHNCNVSSDANLIRAFSDKGFVWIDGNMIDNSANGNDILANNSPDTVKVENNFRYDGSAATVIS